MVSKGQILKVSVSQGPLSEGTSELAEYWGGMPRSDGSLSKITPDPVYKMGLGWDGMGGEARPLAVSQVDAAAQEREQCRD